LQANVPFPSTSDRREKDTTNAASVRHNTSLTSPAYKRWVKSSNYGLGQKPSIGAIQPGLQEPTLRVARDMGKTFSEMENEPLIIIAEMGNHHARAEALRRHIMATDYVGYKEAGKTLEKIAKVNQEGLLFFRFPYQAGIFLAVSAGLGALPMVFDVETAKTFNEAVVTMEVPVASEIDTYLGKSLQRYLFVFVSFWGDTHHSSIRICCFSVFRNGGVDLELDGTSPWNS
jgi:hypothetical protein